MKPHPYGAAPRLRVVLASTAAVLAFGFPHVALAGSFDGVPAAQGVADQAADQFDGNEIVVTATKREQTLQDVPIAVSVTSGEAIERAHVRDLKDLSNLVPSLRIADRQNSATVNFFIRGFGNGANNAGIEPSVGVFVDGVYRSRSAAQIADLPDVERVEVLRGPQSTLFGKNASAGVISIVTAKPKFDFGGNVEASYGNYNAVVLKGLVTGPVTDTLAVSLGGGYNGRDGFARNEITGKGVSDRNRWFVRGQALFEPSSDLSIRLIGDYSKIDEICCTVVNVRAGPATALLTSPLIGGQVNAPADAKRDRLYTNFDSTNGIANYGVSGQVDYDLGAMKVTSITAWRRTRSNSNFDSDYTSADLLRGSNIGNVGQKTFTQELRVTARPTDNLDLLLGGFYYHESIRQAAELSWGTNARAYADGLVRSLSGNTQSIAGLEGLFGALTGNPSRYTGQFFKAGPGMTEAYSLKNRNFSLFGQADFHMTDRLTLTGGLAYTNDRKRFATNVVSHDAFSGVDLAAMSVAAANAGIAQAVGGLIGAPGGMATPAQIAAFAAGNAAAYTQIQTAATAAGQRLLALRQLQFFPPFLNVPNAVEDGRTSDDKFTYTARLAYDATDTVNVYVSYATGYKASSINLSRDSRPAAADAAAIGAAGIAVVNQTYGSRSALPENSRVFEGGIKGNWGVVTANFAVFHQAIKGFQSNVFTGTGFILSNAGKQSVFGVEFEGTARPIPALTLGLAMTYLDPRYDSFVNSAFGDASGRRPADIPPISATFSGEYEHDFANDDRLILRGSYHYESRVQILEGLPAFIQRNPITQAVLPGGYLPGLAAARPYTRQVDEVDGSLTWAMRSGLELSVWGRNLLDDRNFNGVFDSPAQQGSISAYLSAPRTYGVGARLRW
ncbi:MAG: TonB-dependent receptor [Novosphingobium sp.]|nr:TonB-dependent receptor [Novosphingobium sp.]